MKHLRFSINRKFWFLIVLSIFLCTFPHCSNSTHHNQPPVADAGQDITLVIPADQTTASVSLDAEEWVSGLHSWQQGNDHYPCPCYDSEMCRPDTHALDTHALKTRMSLTPVVRGLIC